MNQRRVKLDAIRRRRRISSNEFGELLVRRKQRAVRITAITNASRCTGKPTAASFAFVDLDDAAVDRLIRRLQAIRGGKRALP